jgi:hypothetical protein
MIGIQEGIPSHGDGAGARENPHEIEALANTGAGAVQHGGVWQAVFLGAIQGE